MQGREEEDSGQNLCGKIHKAKSSGSSLLVDLESPSGNFSLGISADMHKNTFRVASAEKLVLGSTDWWNKSSEY